MSLGSSSLVFVADADHLTMRVGPAARSLELETPVVSSPAATYSAVERGRIQDIRPVLGVLERELHGAWSVDSLIGMSEMCCAVPGFLTPVECTAYTRLCRELGARHVRLVSGALCALMGVGESVAAHQPSILLLLHPDTAELAIVVAGQQTGSVELPISFHEVMRAIDRHIRMTYGIQLSSREFALFLRGFSLQSDAVLTPTTISVHGINARTHAVKLCEVETGPCTAILLQFIDRLCETIDEAVSAFPPAALQSLVEQGMVLFGSIPPIHDFDLLLAHHLQFPVSILPDAGEAVVKGLLQMRSHSRSPFLFEVDDGTRILGLTKDVRSTMKDSEQG